MHMRKLYEQLQLWRIKAQNISLFTHLCNALVWGRLPCICFSWRNHLSTSLQVVVLLSAMPCMIFAFCNVGPISESHPGLPSWYCQLCAKQHTACIAYSSNTESSNAKITTTVGQGVGSRKPLRMRDEDHLAHLFRGTLSLAVSEARHSPDHML